MKILGSGPEGSTASRVVFEQVKRQPFGGTRTHTWKFTQLGDQALD